ncbi:hypothetical protein J7M22_06195 [Candidatus Poribacteria bacterium]|nr:hypothetical protein [Candidatus Poribacteria bacterium]
MLRLSILLFLAVIGLPEWAIARNIVSNPGLEIGEVGGLPKRWESQKEGGAEGRVILTDENPHTGRRCLLIEHTNSRGYIHPNKDVEIEKGDYIFRFWARSDRDLEFPAQIYRRTDWSLPFDRRCRLKGGAWTKFEFYLRFNKSFPGSIQIGLSDMPGRLWLDDIKLIKWEIPPEKGWVRIWDTLLPIDKGTDITDRTTWGKITPSEARGYRFKGDAVAENGYLILLLKPDNGKAILYSKADSGPGKRAEIGPFGSRGPIEISIHTGRKAVLKFGPSTLFSIGIDRIVRVESVNGTEGINIAAPIRFGVVPSIIGDDLIFDPDDYPSLKKLHIAAETLFMGLLDGEGSMLVLVYPPGKVRTRLVRKDHLFGSVELETGGEPIYLASLDGPGIWHEVEFNPSYLERDVTINWKRPFPAKWVVQLYEDDVRTRYHFKELGERIWRAGIGWYIWPVRFDDGKAVFHLSKRVPPKGKAVIYFLERDETTPFSVMTPIDVARKALGDEIYAFFDFEGRLQRSLRRENAVIGAATCGVTDGMEPIFKAGKEVEMRRYIEGGADDMVYFIGKQRERINEYLSFAREMLKFLESARRDHPHSKRFLDEMERITRQIFDEYNRERENIKDLRYADELARRTKALTLKHDPKNLQAFLQLKMEWRRMGGAQDYLVRKFHTITRRLFQEAGYRCVTSSETVDIALGIRERCRRCLRNPDGYEIWEGY